MQEIWKVVPDYSRYEVSNFGRVRSYATSSCYRNKLRKTPRMLALVIYNRKAASGYARIRLHNEQGHKFENVARIVLSAFICKCPEGMEACHNNGNKTDNQLDNLRWDTRKGNFVDRAKHGNTYQGERHHETKFTNQDIRDIRERIEMGETQVDIARDYNVTKQNIGYIARRVTWKHVV